MASSGNFPLWSPLIKGATNLSAGNTRFDGSTNSKGSMTSFAIPTGTKFYVECLVTHATNYNIVFGIANPEFNVGGYDESDASMNGILFRANSGSSWDTCSLTNGSRGSFGSNVGTTSARVLAMTINRVDNEIKMYLDNSLKHTISISATEVYHIVCSFTGGTNSSIHMNINGGHDSTGAGDFSAGGNADENGFGDFQHSPATGFLAPSSANLPISDDIDPAQTDDYPSKLMSTSNWSGSGGSKSITGLGFQPDLTIIKAADAASSDWALFDSSRGVQKLLEPNTTAAEETNSNSLTAFGADGFTVGSDSRVNDSGRLMTAQSWRCNAGTTASNSEGSITSTVQANTKAGFSIITFTSPSSSADQTVGHGLAQAPEFIIVKKTNSSANWNIFHKDLGANQGLRFTTATPISNAFGSMSATTIGVKSPYSYASGDNYVHYAWHSVEGYSKFGKYEGNGNADGPFIYTGHMPRCVWIKRTDSSAEWAIYFWNDTSVNSSYVSLKQNPLDSRLTFDAGSMNNGEPVDFLSNGYKIRDSDAILNSNGGTYIYSSWGSVPFKYNNTF